jgi:hypothetical protein
VKPTIGGQAGKSKIGVPTGMKGTGTFNQPRSQHPSGGGKHH